MSINWRKVRGLLPWHSHVEADITDLGPYAADPHTHVEADITDLGTYGEVVSGTFTPTVQDDSLSDSESQTYSAQQGYYYKVGNLVFFTVYLTMSSLGSLTGTQQTRIAGLPFTAGSSIGYAISTGYNSGINSPAVAAITGLVPSGTTRIELYLQLAGGTIPWILDYLTASGTIILSGTYVST